MAVNKVEANGETLIDLTNDTVTADTLVEGRTAHLASGEQVTGTFKPVTGVKGNVETSYRTGNVNLTPANIGAVNKSGDTVTGNIVYKMSDVDASLINNNLSAIKYATTLSCEDKINRILCRNEGIINPNGNVGWYAYVRNYNTSGTQVAQKGLKMEMNKSGTLTWTVNDAANFRSAINAASKDQVNYNTNNGVKNLLKVDIPEKTVAGLTFTPQSDGTIIINGTANVPSSGIAYWNLENPSNTTVSTQHSLNKIGYGNFIMSLNSGEEHIDGMNLQILCYDTITESPTVTAYVAVGESKSVTIGEDKKYVWFRLMFTTSINGKTFNNFVYKPMIRDATIEDSTFAPYAKSNAELTADIPLTIHIDYSNIDAHTCDSTYNECLSALESGRAVIAMIQITSKLMRPCFFGLDTDTKIICGEIPNGNTSYYFDWRTGEDCPSIGISS